MSQIIEAPAESQHPADITCRHCETPLQRENCQHGSITYACQCGMTTRTIRRNGRERVPVERKRKQAA